MGKHSKDRCFECGSQKDVVFVSWYLPKGAHPRDKGRFLCSRHDLKETSNYIKGSDNG